MANVNPEQLQTVNIQYRKNARGTDEHFIKGEHVSLQRLKEQMLLVNPQGPMMTYLRKEIPPYPCPVEFCVSDVAHVTVEAGFKAILESEQFRPGAGEFSWWGLKINKEDIRAAERLFMENDTAHFPNSEQEQELTVQEKFLDEFTTSPAFEAEKSRYGNYRFTFPLAKLVQWYKEQNCGGAEPILRVHETVTYSQEIMFTVLIHSPEDNQRFREYPLLEESEWVRYQDGKIIWKAQAICKTHNLHFVSGKAHRLHSHQYYVWDHVSLVFHLPNDASVKIPRTQLIEAFEACKLDEVDLSRNDSPPNKEERFLEAEMKMRELKIELEG